MAPIAPFLSDEIHAELSGGQSVHLSFMLEPEGGLEDEELEAKMALTRKVVELGRNLRSRHNLKVRQPLRAILIQSTEEILEELVLQELNVKCCERVGLDDELVKKKAKADFKKLGPLFGKRVQKLAPVLAALGIAEITAMEKAGGIEVEVEGEMLLVPSDCVQILSDQVEGLVAESEDGIMVALRTELDGALLEEGLAREFVNRMQNFRKDSGLEITDRIHLEVSGDETLLGAIANNSAYVYYELLALEGGFAASSAGHIGKFEIEGREVSVRMEKAAP
ncbi:MAG: class I tRNA ligase family protein, partial [Planctomycetes bacterium]|nr:class I tRNA ligase family protein [Planctomycetota bacterium]